MGNEDRGKFSQTFGRINGEQAVAKSYSLNFLSAGLAGYQPAFGVKLELSAKREANSTKELLRHPQKTIHLKNKDSRQIIINRGSKKPKTEKALLRSPLRKSVNLKLKIKIHRLDLVERKVLTK